MKRFLITGAALLSMIAASDAASAADLSRPVYTKAPALVSPLYDWSGFYIGVNGGGASSRECWDLTSNNNIAIVPNLREGCHNATGAVAGGQIGYRWQVASWVFGVEALGDWANLKGSNISQALTVQPLSNQTKVNAITMFTGQVGYAVNNVLLYVKGGAAMADNAYSSTLTLTGAQVYQTTEDRWGGVVGAGLEYGFAPNWSIGAEYDHLFMTNSTNVAFPATNLAVARGDTIRQSIDMGTVRLNYRFGGSAPVIARY